jgi:hypothetical protein
VQSLIVNQVELFRALTTHFLVFNQASDKSSVHALQLTLFNIIEELVARLQMEPGWQKTFELAFFWFLEVRGNDEASAATVASDCLAECDILVDYHLPSAQEIEALSSTLARIIQAR